MIEPATTLCPCCQGAMHAIGEDRSERLDVIPMRYQVVVARRPKYGCRTCQSTVVQAPAPPRLMEGGLPTERMVAHVLVTKYADHAPLYRQAQMLSPGRESSSTARPPGVLGGALCGGVAEAAVAAAARRAARFGQAVRRRDQGAGARSRARSDQDRVLFGRSPAMTGLGAAATRRWWSILTRPGATEHAAALLKDFRGILQTDAYVVYKKVATPPGIEAMA